MTRSKLNNRLRTLAALAALRGDAELSGYMSEADAAAFEKMLGVYSDEENRHFKMEQLIQQMASSEKFSNLAEVHPAWILEKLKDESPRVIGIILRALPSKHISYILKNMPPMLKVQLPSMVESFAVAAPVLELIRRRFESNFLPMRLSRDIEKFEFEHLYYLKGNELEELISELGLIELGVALSSLGGKTLGTVYNRLPLKEAKRLQGKIKGFKNISLDMFRQARYSILEMEGSHIGSDRLLTIIGLQALASAAFGEDDTFIDLVVQRLCPTDGYLLKRFVEEKRFRPNASVTMERRLLVMEALQGLLKEGKIDSSWSTFLKPSAEEEEISAESQNPQVSEDETVTSQVLA